MPSTWYYSSHPELPAVPTLAQMLSVTVNDCSLLALTSSTITAC